ncbi:MAG: hypothetical protein M1587_11950, partial [Thaumarchaeota archaeon]|nr:hypothetical protein [Nitrososphaerota archaeon]
MMSEQIRLEDVAGTALAEASRRGCSDVAITTSRTNDAQVRFANNSITLVNNVRNVTLDVYVAKDRKRIVGTTYNPSESGIKRFMERLVKSCESLPPSQDYVGLPKGPFKYS